MEKSQAIEAVRKNRGGSIEGCYGPRKLNGFEVWEVWVKKNDLYETRFVVEEKSGEQVYFDDFSMFCSHVDEEYDAILLRIEKIKSSQEHAHRKELIRLYVSCFLVLGFGMTFIWMVLSEKSLEYIIPLLGGLLASAGTLVFGVWTRGVPLIESNGAPAQNINIQK